MNQLQTQFYEQLDKLDDYLADKNSSERALFGLIVGAAIAAALYFGVYDMASEYRAGYEYSHNDISTKVAEERDYINSMDSGGFLALEQQISSTNEQIVQAQGTLKRLNGLLNDVFDSSRDWFLTFDEASKKATELGLIVNATDIEFQDNISLGGMTHSNFVLYGYGRYNKILEYIDWLETFGQFVSLDSIIIESKDNRLNFSILIRNFKGGV
ncbi:hypothetical protein ACWIUD_10440 [Helicobacter sp. 23-1044]